MERSDTELVKQALAGDRAAFGVLVTRHSPWLWARLVKRLSPREAAEDVLQDAFVDGFQRLSTLQDPDRFGAWLCGIADNKARMWHRRRRVQLSWLEGLEPASAPGAAEEADLRTLVREALGRLTRAHRDVVVHHYLKGYSYQRTAAHLGLEVGTVRSRLQKARRRLAKEIAGMSDSTKPQTFDLGAKDMSGLRHAAHFLGRDDRAILRCICLDAGGRIVATDGSRLLDWPAAGLQSLTAPVLLSEVRTEAIPESPSGTLTVGEEEARLRAADGAETVFALEPGPYVKYEDAVAMSPPGAVGIEVDGDELASCVQAMDPFMACRHPVEELPGWKYAPRVELRISGLDAHFCLRTSRDLGYHADETATPGPVGPAWDFTVRCPAEITGLAGDTIRVAVNHEFLRCLVASLCGEGQIRIRLSQDDPPRLHFDTTDGRRALLMPMVWQEA